MAGMTGRGLARLLSLAAPLALAACAATRTTTGEVLFTHPGESALRIVADRRVDLTLTNTGSVPVAVRVRYGEDDPVDESSLDPGAKRIQSFEGESLIRLASLAGPQCRVAYRVVGDATVAVSGRADKPLDKGPVKVRGWRYMQVEER